MKNIVILAVTCMALGAAFAARADFVRTRSGKVIEGVLAPGSGDDKVRLWVGPAQVSFTAAQIDSVTTGSAADNIMIDARYQFQGRRAQDGVEKLGLAAEQGAPLEKIAALLAAHGDALGEAIPQLPPTARDTLSQLLDRIEALPAPQGAVLPELSRLFLHIGLGEGAKAQAILDRIGPTYMARHADEKSRLGVALVRALDAWSQAEDFANGQTAIQMLSRIDPHKVDGAALMFYLQWGAYERRSGRTESAVRIYSQYVTPLDALKARDRIMTALREAEQTAREQRRLPEAIQLYETFGMKADAEASKARLAQIWHDEGWSRLWDSRYAEARTAFTQAQKYKKTCASNCAETDLNQCEWRERRAKLAKEDIKGHAALGDWCAEKEMFDAAISEYRIAEQDPQLFAEVSARLETLRSKLAEARLAQIMTYYEKGDLSETMKRVTEFMHEDHPAGYLAQAKQIESMTQESLKMRTAQRPQQAESLYRQAEHAFYDEDYAKARGLLETIAKLYADTVAYPRASALAALVEQKLDVAALETGKKPKPIVMPKVTTTSATLAGIQVTTGSTVQITNAIDLPNAGGDKNAPVTLNLPKAAAAAPPAKGVPATAGQGAASLPAAAERDAVNGALQNLLGQEGAIHAK